MAKDINTRRLNEVVVGGLTSEDHGLRKEAQSKVNNYLRMKQRDEGFARKQFDVVEITPADLDKQVDTPLPVIVKDKEPNSAGAMTVPFGTLPMDSNITAPRYRIMVDRIVSARYYADVNQLLTYDMDIRQILKDFILLDILDEEDRKFIVTANAGLGALNTPVAALGSCTWATMGAFGRDSVVTAMEALGSSNRNLTANSALVNNLTAWQFAKFDRIEAGGDLAEEMLLNGVTQRNFLGLQFNITLKKELIAKNVMYMFAKPEFLGDFVVLDNVTLSTKHEDYMLSFFAYESIGCTIGNTAAICRADFTGTATDWITGASSLS